MSKHLISIINSDTCHVRNVCQGRCCFFVAVVLFCHETLHPVSPIKNEWMCFVRGELHCRSPPRCRVWEEETKAAAWAPYGLQALHGSGDWHRLTCLLLCLAVEDKLEGQFRLCSRSFILFKDYTGLNCTISYVSLLQRSTENMSTVMRAVCVVFAVHYWNTDKSCDPGLDSLKTVFLDWIRCVWLTVLVPFQRPLQMRSWNAAVF